jgi:hypothetical protein
MTKSLFPKVARSVTISEVLSHEANCWAWRSPLAFLESRRLRHRSNKGPWKSAPCHECEFAEEEPLVILMGHGTWYVARRRPEMCGDNGFRYCLPGMLTASSMFPKWERSTNDSYLQGQIGFLACEQANPARWMPPSMEIKFVGAGTRQKGKCVKVTYLQAPWCNFPGDSNGVFHGCSFELGWGHRIYDLPDNIVPRVAIKTQHDEMQRHFLRRRKKSKCGFPFCEI